MGLVSGKIFDIRMHDTLHPVFLTLIVAFLLTATATTAYGYYHLSPPFPSPAEQAGAGAEPSDIRCNDDRVRTIHPDGRGVCVTRTTADRMGWEVTEPVLTAEDIVGSRYRTHGTIAAAMICDESGPGVWNTTHPAIYQRLNTTGVLEPVCEDIEFVMLHCPRIGLLASDYDRSYYSESYYTPPSWMGKGLDAYPTAYAPHPIDEIEEYLLESGLVKLRGWPWWDPNLNDFTSSDEHPVWCHTVDFDVATPDECKHLFDIIYDTTEGYFRLDNHLRYGPNDSTHVYDFDPDGPGVSKDPARDVAGHGQPKWERRLDFERDMAMQYIERTVLKRWCG